MEEFLNKITYFELIELHVTCYICYMLYMCNLLYV